MKLASTSIFLTLSSLLLISQALPLSTQQEDTFVVRRKVPYSVVAVDGGSPAPPTTQIETTEATTTVVSTQPPPTLPVTTEVSTMPASTEVVTTTMIESASGSTSAVVVTMTPVASSPTDSPSPAQFTETSAEVTTTDTAYATVTGDVFIHANPVTFTAPSSASYYDNGMWHTSYVVKPIISLLTSASETVPTSSSLTLANVPAIPTQNLPQNGTYYGSGSASDLLRRSKQHSSTLPSDHPSPPTITQQLQELPTDLPRLPTTSAEAPNLTEIPAVDTSEMHMGSSYDR